MMCYKIKRIFEEVETLRDSDEVFAKGDEVFDRYRLEYIQLPIISYAPYRESFM